ncbi:hypothetical protein YPPY03_1557 [Yersinia pestis PY-03]|nr:hypothetical protein YPPY03_1557 [Yersinia pestis PY-03]
MGSPNMAKETPSLMVSAANPKLMAESIKVANRRKNILLAISCEAADNHFLK